MGAESRSLRNPIRILAIAGLVFLLFGGWRLATRFSGHPERYFWLDVKQLEDHLQEVTVALEKTSAELKAEGGTLSPEARAMKESNQKNQEQLVRDIAWIRDGKIEDAASQELRLGFFSTMLGLAGLGTAVYLLIRRP